MMPSTEFSNKNRFEISTGIDFLLTHICEKKNGALLMAAHHFFIRIILDLVVFQVECHG